MRKGKKVKVAYPMKRVMALFLIFACFVGLFSVEAEAEELSAAKKIISIVYDDSGSMFNAEESWASANYAMQVFAALLNKQDEMYITYMSDITSGNRISQKVDLTNVESAVKNIRAKTDSAGGTPLDAVDIAFETLKSVNETDVNAQYWLVVLTDGDMYTHEKSNYDTVDKTLDAYAGTKMKNGSSVYISFVGIGSAADGINEDKSRNLMNYPAGTDIVPVLTQLSNLISGRIKFEDSEITKIDEQTVKVRTNIPLYSISVFSQNSQAIVESVTSEKGLNVERNIGLRHPDAAQKISLIGNAAVIDNGNKVVPAGEYTIKFSENISLKDTVFMYQPAIKMKAVITRSGIEISDPNTLMTDDKIDVEIVPTNPETGDPIDQSLLPSGVKWKVTYEVDGTVKKEKEGQRLSDIKVESGSNKIIASMQIPDYIPMVEMITFEPGTAITYGINVNQPDDLKYARKKLGRNDGDDNVVFQIVGNGEPLKEDELKNIDLDITEIKIDDSEVKGFLNRFGFKKIAVKLKQNDDGTYTIYPERLMCPAFLLKAGTYKVTVALSNDAKITATGTFEVVPSLADWSEIWWLLVLLVVILYLCYIIFVKAKFDGQTAKIDAYAPRGSFEGTYLPGQSSEETLKKIGSDILAPKRQCEKVVGGLRIYASPEGGVYIKKKAIMGYNAWGRSSANLVTHFDAVKRSLKPIDKDDKTLSEEIYLDGTPLILKQGRMLYKIEITEE